MKLKLAALSALAAVVTAVLTVSALAGPASKSPITIGLVISKTGWMAAYDAPPMQGAQLAVRDINAKGGVLGRPLKLAVFDQKTKPELGSTGAEQLISQGAVALIVACDYDIGAPAALVGTQKHVPSMSTCAGDPKFGVQGIGPYAYTMANTTNYEGAALADWAYRKMGWRTAYVITDTGIEYTKGIAKFTAKVFQQLGGKIVGQDTMVQSDASLAPQITKLEAAKPKPDFVILSSFTPGLATAVKQIRAAGLTLPLVGGAGWDGTYWLKSIPNLSNAYHGAVGYVDGPGIAREWAIAQKFIKTYHQKPINAYFLTGYANVEAIAEAIRRAGTTDGVKMNAKLQTLHNFPTVMGPLTYTPTWHSPGSYPEVIIKYSHGKQVLVTRSFPKNVPNPFK